jgi:hypothetical protein
MREVFLKVLGSQFAFGIHTSRTVTVKVDVDKCCCSISHY